MWRPKYVNAYIQYIHTYMHTNLYSAKIVERIWGGVHSDFEVKPYCKIAWFTRDAVALIASRPVVLKFLYSSNFYLF